MLKTLIILSLVLSIPCLAISQANQTPLNQNNRRVYKLKIRHADPALIFKLLQGKSDFSTEPETSSKPKKSGS